jgi:hypothetical protein
MNGTAKWAGLPATSAALILGPATLADVDFAEYMGNPDIVGGRVSLVDLDSDDDLDVVEALTYRIFWYENSGTHSPSFTRRSLGTVSGGNTYAADIDGDGDIDVALATGEIPCNFPSELAWLENDGGSPPSFTHHTILAECHHWRDIFVADINGDGHQDILTGRTLSDHLSWYENDGASPPSFTERVIRDANLDFWGVWAEDLDGDNDLDVISGVGDAVIGVAGEIDWYENDGSSAPTFHQHVMHVVASLGRPVQVTATDLDGDGDPDVIALFAEGDKVFWYESDGGAPPIFTPHLIESGPVDLRRIAVGDVDLDGNTDVLIVLGSSDAIAWYESDGGSPPMFAQHLIPNTLSTGASADLGDLDGDRDLDVVAHRGPCWPRACGETPLNWYKNLTVSCPWDLDASGGVGTADLLALLSAWGTDPGGPPDFDGDGNVGTSDLLELLTSWGRPCS